METPLKSENLFNNPKEVDMSSCTLIYTLIYMLILLKDL